MWCEAGIKYAIWASTCRLYLIPMKVTCTGSKNVKFVYCPPQRRFLQEPNIQEDDIWIRKHFINAASGRSIRRLRLRSLESLRTQQQEEALFAKY
jgi:hypothetical protein